MVSGFSLFQVLWQIVYKIVCNNLEIVTKIKGRFKILLSFFAST